MADQNFDVSATTGGVLKDSWMASVPVLRSSTKSV